MREQPKNLSELTNTLTELLPAYFCQKPNVKLLLNQISQNSSILQRLPFDNANRSQFQLLEKCLDHLLTLESLMEAEAQFLNAEHPYKSELEAYIDQTHNTKIKIIIKDLENNQLARYTAFHFASKLTRRLGNFQASRIPALEWFYKDLSNILDHVSDDATKLTDLQQATINFYYHMRRTSRSIKYWLFRNSRETRLANTLETFINQHILLPYNIKVPHKISKNDNPINMWKVKKKKLNEVT